MITKTDVINIELDFQQKVMAAAVGCERLINVNPCIDPAYGAKPMKGLEKWGTDVEGAMAQLAVATYLKSPWTARVGEGFRLLPDIHPDIYVRSTGHATGNLIVRKDDDKNSRYVLAVGMFGKYKIIGWALGSEVMLDRWLDKPNPLTPECYAMNQYYLRPIKELYNILHP